MEPYRSRCVASDPSALDAGDIVDIAKGLAHPARIAIVEQFECGQPLCAGDIAARSPLAQSTVSEHLRILRDSGILYSCPDGGRTFYCIRPGVLRQFGEAVTELYDRFEAARGT